MKFHIVNFHLNITLLILKNVKSRLNFVSNSITKYNTNECKLCVGVNACNLLFYTFPDILQNFAAKRIHGNQWRTYRGGISYLYRVGKAWWTRTKQEFHLPKHFCNPKYLNTCARITRISNFLRATDLEKMFPVFHPLNVTGLTDYSVNENISSSKYQFFFIIIIIYAKCEILQNTGYATRQTRNGKFPNNI